MGECAYAAVSDQLLSVRGRPGRLRGVGVSGAAVVLDPLRNRPCPKPACFASVCQFMLLLSQALDALAVQRSRSPGFAHRRFKRLTIPTAKVRCGPYRALKKCHERPIGDRNVGKSTDAVQIGRQIGEEGTILRELPLAAWAEGTVRQL